MIQMKAKSNLSMVKCREIAESRDRIAPRKSVEPVDHWAFLDEIEAPMWADLYLELEATSGYKDVDEDWFHISHPFHQCSSRQLISALSHAGESKAHVDLGIHGLSSPKLPPSVSRSRGKHYKSKEWAQNNYGITSSKQHPIRNLSSKSLWVNSGSGQKLKPKPSNENRKETARSKSNLVCESSLTENAIANNPNPSVNILELRTNSNSSTITSESSEKRQLKLCEASNQTFGRTSGILSELKVTLRKSCVTRQASRVVRHGGRQSEGRKSSSGKSSVGSSSHPEYDFGNAIAFTLKSKDATPHCRNAKKMPQAKTGKVEVSNTTKESKSESLVTRCDGKTTTAKLAHQETAKSKVTQVVNSKAMRLYRGNEFVAAVTKANCKPGAGRYNKLGDGKENRKGRIMSQKTIAGAGGLVEVQKPRKRIIAPQKSDRVGLIGPKRKISCYEGKSLPRSSVTRLVHFR